MRKFTAIIVLAMVIMLPFFGQDKEVKLYDPEINPFDQVEQALEQAKKEDKHVLIQVGGNWCPWCIKLHQFMHETPQLDSLLKADYVLIRVNYSKENKNPEMMAHLGYPQRFGFPVLVFLDQEGNRLHTQNTGILEKDDFYSEEKIAGVLKNWNRSAVDPARYEK